MSAEAAQPSASGLAEGRGAAKIVALISVAHFYSHFFFMVLPPLYPVLTGELRLDYTQIALLLVVFNVVTGFTQAPMGLLVDRIGATRLLIAAVAVQGAVLAAMAAWPVYPLMLAAMAVAGLANAVYHPADYSILSNRIAGTVMGRAFSVHTFSGFIGGAVAPSIIIALATLVDWKFAIGVSGAAGLVMAAGLAAARDSLNPGPAAAAKKKAETPLSLDAWLKLILSPPILLTFVFWVLIALSSNGVTYFAVSTFTELSNMPLVQANTVLTAYLVGSSLGILVGGQIGDRTARHQLVVVAGCALGGLGIVAAGLVALPVFALAILFFASGVAWGIPTPSRDLLVRKVSPANASGAVFGFVSTGFNVGSIAGPLLFAGLLDNGLADWVFPVSGALMVLTGVLVLAIPEPKGS
ncbi:MAG: MFS transporter [Rhodospirillaceae bacterium]|nr:MFS transporter [Rhodospirillaceae bacterium]